MTIDGGDGSRTVWAASPYVRTHDTKYEARFMFLKRVKRERASERKWNNENHQQNESD